jgi:energy-coupling factor transporter ATP-binding protein EcfA2
MITVQAHIQSVDEAICRNIEALKNDRALLSQNILSQLRNLVEGVAVLLHAKTGDAEFKYDVIDPSLAFVRSQGKLNFLGKFHKLLQISASHYTYDGDSSERLMLKYYEYLYRIRNLLQTQYQLQVLENLENFPVNLDPSLQEYHEKIAQKIENARLNPARISTAGRYYIHKIRPFFINGNIYYEVTFYRAINKASKFDRIIAFTHVDMTDKYAANLTYQHDHIDVLSQRMPIIIIRNWEVSIRPCEFKNFARLLGVQLEVRKESQEYRYLMDGLTIGSGSLLDLIDMPDEKYQQLRAHGIVNVTQPVLFPLLDRVRDIVRSDSPGKNVLRYLLLRMHNQILKLPYYRENCSLLSGMRLSYGCIPFDQMPFCTSLPRHNPQYWDLVESIDINNRKHELLARQVKNNVEHYGILYTAIKDLESFDDIETLISQYNGSLYYKHTERQLVADKGHVFIRGYENETVSIIERLQNFSSSGIAGYTQAVERWLNETSRGIDDAIKISALKLLFSQSRVALVYGAAGTGKSTMVDYIAQFFNDKNKLFLAHTNPAIDNLKRKVKAQNSSFRTISSQISGNSFSKECDILIIDECSTVSNADLLKVLDNTTFKLVVLVGDVYQIESIQFGNWFNVIRSFIPGTSVFELTTPYRTNSQSLLGFWDKIRQIEDDLAEVIVRNNYSTVLDKSLLNREQEDEIILCLNYDGLYGINNVNRFLQSSNPNRAISWRDSTYKIGDPILFNETERFRPVIYNNLKGKIADIQSDNDWIQFDVELDRAVSAFDVDGDELKWIEGSTVRFKVYNNDASDDDDDSLHTIVPFQVAYAVSIHKAQGLEYNSVKIVITNANEDNITHSIFYTAVTRTREKLQIFWTPETQQKILENLCHKSNPKDVKLLENRRNLKSTS